MVDFVHKNDIFRIALGIFLSGLILVGSANASTLTVCLSGCSYQQIQKAINASNPGDTIEVRSGTYFENVNISKQLILRGVDTGIGRPVVDAAGKGNAINLTSANSTIDGFYVKNGAAGIHIDWGLKNNTIRNNTADSNIKGFEILYGSNNLTNNGAHSNIQGIYLRSASGSILIGNNASENEEGIILDNSIHNIKLMNNKMTGNKYNFLLPDVYQINKWEIDTSNLVDGKPIYYLNRTKDAVYDSDNKAGLIICFNCVNVTIRKMNFSKNEAGIIFINTTGSLIQNVSTSNNKKGIYLLGSKDNFIDNNSAWNNTISGIELESIYYGDIYSSNSNNLTNNTVWNNEIGIHLKGNPYGNFRHGPYFNTVKDNIAYNNKDGILLRYAKNSTITGNKANNNMNYGIKVDALGVCCGGQFIGWGYNNISQNMVSDNRNGIFLYSTFDTVFENNITNNTNTGIHINSLSCGGAMFDLCGVEAGFINISRNKVEKNNVGIFFNSSENNTLISNNISNNNYGIILNNSKNMIIYDNYFINQNNASVNGTNIWNTPKSPGLNILGGPYLGGNFWAKPDGTGFSQTCPDNNGNGICDNQFELDSINIDYFPLTMNFSMLKNTITIPDIKIPPAFEQRVPIIIYNSTGVGGVTLRLSYDPGILSAYSDPVLDKGDFIDFYASDNSHNTSGYITINSYKIASGMASSKALIGDPVVGYVRLKAVGIIGGSSTLNLSDIVLSDDYGNDIQEYNVQDGLFNSDMMYRQ